MHVPIEDPQVWKRIVPYLDQALDLHAEQVGVWLDDLQGTQPEIATMLRSLLAERDRLNASAFLATPLVELDLAWLEQLRSRWLYLSDSLEDGDDAASNSRARTNSG